MMRVAVSLATLAFMVFAIVSDVSGSVAWWVAAFTLVGVGAWALITVTEVRKVTTYARWRGPAYLFMWETGRLTVTFWEHDPVFCWHLSWSGDLYAFHLTAWPLAVTVSARNLGLT